MYCGYVMLPMLCSVRGSEAFSERRKRDRVSECVCVCVRERERETYRIQKIIRVYA